jgi:hypothetical protein
MTRKARINRKDTLPAEGGVSIILCVLTLILSMYGQKAADSSATLVSLRQPSNHPFTNVTLKKRLRKFFVFSL